MRRVVCITVAAFVALLPVSGQTQDAPTREDVLRLFDALEMEKAYAASLTLSGATIRDAFPGSNEIAVTIDQFFLKYAAWPQVREEYILAYQRIYTQREVNAMTEFYAGVGQGLYLKQQVLVGELARAMNIRIQPHMPELIQQIQAHREGRPGGLLR